MVQWPVNSGTVAQWQSGTVAQWQSLNGIRRTEPQDQHVFSAVLLKSGQTQ